ncbi:Aminotransferase, class I and II [Erwinia tracheiphila PSU-1]|nr:Aminotransferase, class I and II [Erwinia tracheiphila PSU-1]
MEIDPNSEAIVTIGSKEGLAHLMLATLDPGDMVLVPNPGYPIHIYGALIAGAQVRSEPLVVESVLTFSTNWKKPFAKAIQNRK